MLSQHAEELGSTGTVLEACQRATGLKPNEARALLGRFLFSGEAAEKPLDGLSGGERRRLSLAILVHSGANVLILDEPTNHLDLESREALESALQAFPGALLLISHDRALLDAVGTRTIAVEDGTLHSYVGGWAEYVRVREERAEADREAKARARAKPKAKPAPPRAAPKPESKNSSARRGGSRPRSSRPRPSSRRSSRSSPTRRPGTTRARREVDRAPQGCEGARRDALRAAGGGRRLVPGMTLLDRRTFLARGAGAMLTAAAVDRLVARAALGSTGADAAYGYGPIAPTPDQHGRFVLALPAGFSYVTFGEIGSRMSDGNPTPLALDGMAAFPGPDGTVRLIRNHEDRNPPGAGSVGGPSRRSTTHPSAAARRRSTTTPSRGRSCATSSRSTGRP